MWKVSVGQCVAGVGLNEGREDGHLFFFLSKGQKAVGDSEGGGWCLPRLLCETPASLMR